MFTSNRLRLYIYIFNLEATYLDLSDNIFETQYCSSLFSMKNDFVNFFLNDNRAKDLVSFISIAMRFP